MGLSAADAAADGFVTLRHGVARLEELAAHAPQCVATSSADDTASVIGYSLCMNPRAVMTVGSTDLQEIYRPFITMINELSWNSTPLGQQTWVMGGQCCVAKSFRRQGLMKRLYDMQADVLCAQDVVAIVTAIDR